MSIRLRLVLLVVAVLLPAMAAAIWAVRSAYEREHLWVQQSLRETARAMAVVIDRELGKRELIARLLADSPLLDVPQLSASTVQRFYERAGRAVDPIGGQVVLSDVTASQDTLPAGDSARLSDLAPTVDGRLRATLEVPVLHDGRPRYEVAVVITPEAIQRIIDDQRFPAGWIVAVLDRRQTVVARQPDAQRWVGRSATADLRSHIRAQPEGFAQVATLEGQSTSAYFSTSPGYGWTVVVAVPAEALGHSVTKTLQNLLVVALALLLASIGAAVWLGQRVAEPVRQLADQARRLGTGLPLAAEPTGMAECDQVSGALSRAAQQIRDANEKMAAKVADAVTEVQRAHELVAASHRLEALGRLTGGVAHDFNNLLSVVSNNVFLLQRLPREHDPAPQLASIRRAVDAGTRLTRQLLAFSKRQALQPEVIDLPARLPAMLELVQSSIGRRVELQIDIAPDTPPVEVDPAELELALINLAVNAKDAMPEGGHLWIEARPAAPGEGASSDAARRVVISVRDDGPGIAPELQERVFEPFFTTKGPGHGTGLGLSQVYGFCTQAGGAAQIVSAPGAGTTVKLVLPACDKACTPPDDTAGRPVPIARGHLLLVEDNEELARSTRPLLAALGYTVSSATQVDDALRVIERARPPIDVVLSDVVMPGARSGFDLARQLRDERPDLPVILITGYTTELDRAVKAGFEVLPKPCSPETLAAALERARSRQREPAAAH